MQAHQDKSSLLVGVVSDTHGHVANTLSAVRMLEGLEVDVVLHCGDIGTAEIVRLFAKWPTHFVFGNVDDPRELRGAIQAANQTCHERFGALELRGRRMAFLHGDDARQFDETVQSGQYDLVCHGHTHQAREVCYGTTLILNPGALYRANPHSLEVVTLPELKVTTVTV